MNGFQGQVFCALLMLVAGLGIPVMATLNSVLGVRLHSPASATAILFIVGGVVSLGYLLISGGGLKVMSPQPIPLYFYMGGLLVLFYILSVTSVAPKFGVGNTVSFVLLGQLISMALIDHYSLLGASHHPISTQRLFGLGFMVAGVFLAVRRL